MEVKWFFVLIGAIFVVIMLGGIYFIASDISTQSYKQYESNQARQEERFDNSTLVHKYLFDNITEVTKGLNPVFDIIGNATEQKRLQDLHYNQTTQDFETIKQILNLKLQDHELLVSLNKSLAELAGKNFTSGDKNIVGPNPIVINNGTPVPLNNVTN